MREPSRVVDVVSDHVRLAVLEGRLKPGDQLSVPWIARELGVSRGSVREAVLQLVGEGLAQERPRRGVVVATIAGVDIAMIHQVREALEGYAARLCAKADIPDLSTALRSALDAQHRAITEDDGAGYVETDRRFHALLAGNCGNTELQVMISRLHARMRIALTQVAEVSAHRCMGHGELLDVADAIEIHDSDAAETAMRRHIGRTRAAINDVI